MSTTTNDRESEIVIAINQLKVELIQWKERLEHLKTQIYLIEADTQLKYEQVLDELEEKLHQAQVRLQAMLEGSPKEWYEGRDEFHERYADFRTSFVRTARQINNEDDRVALGWLQGFSDERTHDSEGWVEGMGERSVDSEGWVEGMGHRTDDSKGWVEGYDEVNE
jgi:hypothetical protein